MFLVCFAHSSRTLPIVREAGELAVSVLRDSQRSLAELFAGKHDPAEKFQGIDLEPIAGVPAIANAAAAFAGRVEEFVTAGDHDIALLRCTAVRRDPAAEPLLFHHGRFGALA